MSPEAARWRLGAVWFAGAGLLFMLLVAQSLLGFYGGRTESVWSWFLPTVMPTLSLVVGVLVAEARREEAPRPRTIGPALFRLAVGLSAVYLLLVAASIVFAAVRGSAQVHPVEIMQRSNLWLGPLQGLVAAAVGVFFHEQRG
jgi:hypothetical protein